MESIHVIHAIGERQMAVHWPVQHIAQVTVEDQACNLLVAEIFSINLSSFHDLLSVSARQRWS